MTELFSIVGLYTGWRAQNGDYYSSSANFDGDLWDSGYVDTIDAADRAFYAAARRAFCRKYLRKIGIKISPPGDSTGM
ncbi:MAG: hypothetical protein U0938_00705 [Thiobacillus sp.]|jgi:hypothetical protein|nr:hypothetical protein [Thiobacillus sp.]